MKKPLTKKELERKVFELEAHLLSTLHVASKTINKASIDNLMGSSCIITLSGLGGKNIIDPVAVRDGLSKETIEAIKNDFKRSYEIATMFKP